MTYRELLEDAKLNPLGADFTELRQSFTKSSEYVQCSDDEDALQTLADAIDDEETDTAMGLVNRMLEKNYLDIHAHLAAGCVFNMLGDETNMKFHRSFAKGLLDSICQSGDGRSFESPLYVIDEHEEYALLSVCGLKLISRNMRLHRGHQFDVLSVRDQQTGKRFEIYFHVDLPKGLFESNKRVGNRTLED